MTRSRLQLITVFGVGRLRPASGTWGSLPTVLVAALLLLAGFGPRPDGTWPTLGWLVWHADLLLIVLVFGGACVLQGDRAEARYGADPADVVADETAGMALPLMFLPGAALATPQLAAFTLVFAFVCFRAMDVLKPWPADGLQRIAGGWGILLDDLMAGVYALAIVQGVTRGVL